MTKREEFAMAAMQGFLSDSAHIESIMEMESAEMVNLLLAHKAVAFADALLAALEE